MDDDFGKQLSQLCAPNSFFFETFFVYFSFLDSAGQFTFWNFFFFLHITWWPLKRGTNKITLYLLSRFTSAINPQPLLTFSHDFWRSYFIVCCVCLFVFYEWKYVCCRRDEKPKNLSSNPMNFVLRRFDISTPYPIFGRNTHKCIIWNILYRKI